MDTPIQENSAFFRTYMNGDTTGFKPSLFPLAPLKSFLPPAQWGITLEEYEEMHTLDTCSFYDTERSARSLSYVVVPEELLATSRSRLGDDVFAYRSSPAYPSHPLTSTVVAQIRLMRRGTRRFQLCIPAPSQTMLAPLSTLFHQLTAEVRNNLRCRPGGYI